MKSYAATLWRMTKPLPFGYRWGVRAFWWFPVFAVATVAYFSPHPGWWATGVLAGAVLSGWQDGVRKAMRHLSIEWLAQTRARRRR